MGFAAVRVPSVGSPAVGTGVTRQRKPHFPVKNVQFPVIRLVSKPNSSIINGEFQSFPPAAGAADRSYKVEWSEGAPGISTEDLGLGKQQPLLELGFTTNLVQIEPLISTNKDKGKVSNPKTKNANKEEGHDHRVEGGFVVLESNTFGHSFRDYEKESERKASVEEFYKNNHIYQTYEFVRKELVYFQI